MRTLKVLFFPAVLGLMSMGGNALAGNTWNGGGSSPFNWSSTANWGGSAPTYGTITFSGSLGIVNTLDGNFTSNGDANENQIIWTGASSWTVNGTQTLSLYDNSGTQAKVENQSSGSVTFNAPITFAANNATPPNPFGEINAVNGNLTFGSGTLTVNGSSVNGIKLFGGSHVLTFNNTVSATGKWFGITTSGTGNTINIGGAFTSSDFYVMNDGTLNLNAGGSLSTSVRLGGDFGTTGAQNLAKAGTFNLAAASGGQTFAGVINSVSGNTSGTLAANSQNTSGTNVFSGHIALDAPLKIAQAAGGTLNINQIKGADNSTGTDIKAQTLTFTPAAGGLISATGTIYSSTGVGNVLMNGLGALFLGGTNSFTGTLTVQSGTLVLSNVHNFNVSGPFGNSANPVTLGSAGATATLEYTGNTASTTKTFTLATAGTGAFRVDTAGQALTLNGIISGSGTLSKTGPGILILNANHTYSGGTVLSQGTLGFGNVATINLGANGAGNKLTVNGDGVVIATGTTARTPANPVDQQGDLVVDNSLAEPPGTLTFSLTQGPWTVKGGNRKLTVNGANTVVILGNSGTTIVEDGSPRGLRKEGNGRLELRAENSITGGFSIAGGVVRITGSAPLAPFGSATLSTLRMEGGTFDVSGSRSVTTAAIANPVSVTADSAITTSSSAAAVDLNFSSSSITGAPGTTLTFRNDGTSVSGTFVPRLSGAFTYDGKIAIANGAFGTTALQAFNTSSSGDQIFNDVISGTGSYVRTATTAGTAGNTIFKAANTYSGGTTLTDGGIGVGVDSVGIAPSITSGAMGTGVITVSPAGGRLPALFASGAAHVLGNSINLANNTAPLLITGGNSLTLSGAISGSGSITKSGTSTVIMTASNDYTGTTVISQGTLALSGSGAIAGSSVITVNSGTTFDVSNVSGGAYGLTAGQTLKGNGAVNGVLVVSNGAFLTPGTSIGMLTFTNAPVLNGTTMMEVNTTNSPATNDSLVLTSGTVQYGGTLVITNAGPALAGGMKFTLFNAAGYSGAFSGTNLPTLGAGLNWYLGSLVADGSVFVNRPPSAEDKTFSRGKNTTLKIDKASLLVNAADPDAGDSVSYDAVVSAGSQGATVTENGTTIFYNPINNNADTLQYRLKDTRGGTVTKNINISVTNAVGVVSITNNAGGSMTVGFFGIPGFDYVIQRSPDLSVWTDISTNTAGADGGIQFTETPPYNPAFYRSRQY
jgi:fibronectin-binding autotransporter adhesin